MLENIADGVEDLTAYLEEGNVDRIALLNRVASDYELNPALLRRKFQEKHGVVLEQYAPMEKLDPVIIYQAKLEKAIASAKRWASRYIIPAASINLVGKTFKFKGEDYVFVTIDGACHKWGIKAVRISDDQDMQFSLPCWKSIYPQLKEQA